MVHPLLINVRTQVFSCITMKNPVNMIRRKMKPFRKHRHTEICIGILLIYIMMNLIKNSAMIVDLSGLGCGTDGMLVEICYQGYHLKLGGALLNSAVLFRNTGIGVGTVRIKQAD